MELLAAALAAGGSGLQDLLTRMQRAPSNGVLEALIAEVFLQQDPLVQKIMQALAIYNRPVPPAAVDYLLEPFDPASDSEPLLARLVAMNLAGQDAGLYYLHHEMVAYSLSRLPEGQPNDRMASAPPFTRLSLFDLAGGYYAENRTPPETWRTLDDLAPQLAEFEMRYAAGNYEAAAAVIDDIDDQYLERWGHFELVIRMRERLQSELDNPALRVQNSLGLGDCFFGLGQIDKAIHHYQKALDINREIGDRNVEAYILTNLGNCLTAIRETARAIDRYEHALAIYREVGNRNGEAAVQGNLGDSRAVLGEYNRALEHYRMALALYRDIGDRSGEALALSSLGTGYASLGNTQGAIEQQQQALSIYRTTGDRDGEAAALSNLGDCFATLGDMSSATRHHQQALEIYQETGNRNGEATTLDSMGSRYHMLGQTERAIDLEQQALNIYRDIGNRDSEAAALDSLGELYSSLGQTERAINFHQEASAIYRETGNQSGESVQAFRIEAIRRDAEPR